MAYILHYFFKISSDHYGMWLSNGSNKHKRYAFLSGENPLTSVAKCKFGFGVFLGKELISNVVEIELGVLTKGVYSLLASAYSV